jgi:predicted flavoprotein YhiN
LEADAVILATGSAPLGFQIAARMGHDIVPPVPSLFTLQTKHAMTNDNNKDNDNENNNSGLLYGLAGLSVPMARVSFVPAAPEQGQDDDTTTSSAATEGSKKKSAARKNNNKNTRRTLLQQEGPLLITHRGLSVPAILRLSAFGALDFYKAKYRGELRIHWAPLLPCGNTVEEVAQALWQQTTLRPKKTILSGCPLFIETMDTTTTSSSMSTTTTAAIPRRLWASLARAAGCHEEQVWASCSKKLVRKLAMLIADCRIQVTGKDVFKEEFVTAGGIDLKQVDMRTMQSKICSGLYVCGEVINVDGVTGGFNFLNCWSTGHVAGVHAATTTTTSASSSSLTATQ